MEKLEKSILKYSNTIYIFLLICVFVVILISDIYNSLLTTIRIP